MRIEYLYYFLEVSSTLSLSKASQNCHITQQTMSNALKVLEEKFEVKLYTRTNYGIRLTDDGERIKTKIGEMLNIYNSIFQDIKSNNALPEKFYDGSIFVVFPSIVSFLADEFTKLLKDNYNSINVTVVENSNYNAALCLPQDVDEDIIIYFVMKHEYTPDLLSNNEKYIQTVLRMDEIVIIAGQRSPLFNKKTISNKTLYKYPFVTFYNDDCIERLNPIISPYGNTKRVLRTNNLDRILENVINGDCLTFGHSISKKHPQYKNKKFSIVKLKEKIGIYYVLAIKKDVMEKPYVKDAVEFIKSLM